MLEIEDFEQGRLYPLCVHLMPGLEYPVRWLERIAGVANRVETR